MHVERTPSTHAFGPRLVWHFARSGRYGREHADLPVDGTVSASLIELCATGLIGAMIGICYSGGLQLRQWKLARAVDADESTVDATDRLLIVGTPTQD